MEIPRRTTRVRALELILGVTILLLVVEGCGEKSTRPEPLTIFSFEHGMDGWVAAAADTGSPGRAYAPWSIEPTSEFAHDGERSLELHMDNFTDAAKIWIVRPFSRTPGRSYEVDVSYEFTTSDYGSANLFTLLTGVFRDPPADGGSLVAGAVHESTGNGADNDVGYMWIRKSFEISAPADTKDRLYVVIGVWGTWETPRTYYLDDIEIVLREEPGLGADRVRLGN